jgi:hypothetical protein
MRSSSSLKPSSVPGGAALGSSPIRQRATAYT